jgi:hypothetical protein
MLGQVLRVFHEQPVLGPLEADGEPIQLQIVFRPLSPEDLNHIWATQSEAVYRTSVAYEVALVPILPARPSVGTPLVGAIGHQTAPRIAARHEPFAGEVAFPTVRKVTVDTRVPGWAPAICFVVEGGYARSLVFEAGSQAVKDFVPAVWVAGNPVLEEEESVRLQWQIWDPDQGWRDSEPSVDATPMSTGIDPDAGLPASVSPVTIGWPAPTTLPLGTGFTDGPGQAVLYAVRTYRRAADEALMQVRSDPLLITLYSEPSA